MMLRHNSIKSAGLVLLTCMWLIVLCCWPIDCLAQHREDSAGYYKQPDNSKIIPVKSKYNYVPLATEITAGCNSDYEKIKAVYKWICEHIAYDTSYKIRTADECLKKQKGVCQAYCELFYLLAKAVGVRVETIEGKAKDQTGFVNPAGHAWLFAYTRENYGVLLDPTWGAGSVVGTQFIPDENIWTWFNVSPEWMIMTHFPDDASCQLVENAVTEKEFMAFPPVKLTWMEYGLDGHKLFGRGKKMALVLPQFYNGGEGLIEFIDFPFLTSLRIGIPYTFRIKVNTNRDFAIMNNGVVCEKNEWTDEGNGVYSVKFMPRQTESLSISLRDESGSAWGTIVRYGIATPTQTDWDLLALEYPLSTPDMKAVKNLNAKEWAQAGVDERQLAKLIKENNVRELPVLFDSRSHQLTIVAVPMSRELSTGESYTFSFYPKSGVKWAIVNGQEWFTDWQVAEDGMYSMTVSPKTSGKLSLFVQDSEGDAYWPCLEYAVP